MMRSLKLFQGFTLIELLVVITIIVVLLALLTPSLDRAIYQAELAVCATNHKGIANGALVYAADQRRKFPYRSSNDGRSTEEPDKLRIGAFEDRTNIRGFIGLKMMVDPFVEQIDLDPASTENSVVWSTVDLYYWWQYRVEGTSTAGMYKMGDRWAWEFNGRKNRFTILSGDGNSQNLTRGWAHATHQDKDGLMTLSVWQNDPNLAPTATPINVGPAADWVASRWDTSQTNEIGELDQNFSYADGSVRRVGDVKHMTSGNGDPADPGDKRMVRVPQWNTAWDGPTGEVWTYVPKR